MAIFVYSPLTITWDHGWLKGVWIRPSQNVWLDFFLWINNGSLSLLFNGLHYFLEVFHFIVCTLLLSDQWNDLFLKHLQFSAEILCGLSNHVFGYLSSAHDVQRKTDHKVVLCQAKDQEIALWTEENPRLFTRWCNYLQYKTNWLVIKK